MKITQYLFTALLLISSSSQAIPILDQTNEVSAAFTVAAPNPNSDAGQSFIVGLSGVLDSIDLLGWNQATAYPASREHTLSIFNFGSAYTSGNAIATITQTATSYSRQWFHFDFSEFNIQVNAGDKLLMLWTSEGEFNWVSNYLHYSQGDRFIRNSYYSEGIFIPNQDQVFRTYISQVPEPSSYLLMLLGIALLILKSKRPRILFPFH